MHDPRIRGLVPVLATPFTEDLSIDVPSLRRLVEFQLSAGADAVAIFGMASESFTLTHEERTTILDETVSTAGDLPVVAGVSATAVAPALEQLHQIATGGARAAMVLPPFMVKASPAHIEDFYGTLGAEARTLGISIMVQDAPGATGVTMTPDFVARLADLDGVDSVKVEAPPTVPKMWAVNEALDGRDMVMFGGQNAQFVLDEFVCGAVGTMPACEFTDALADVLARWTAGDAVGARAAFGRLLPLIVWGLQSGYAWAVHKEVLVRRGIIAAGAVRPPARSLPQTMIGMLADVLAPLELKPVP